MSGWLVERRQRLSIGDSDYLGTEATGRVNGAVEPPRLHPGGFQTKGAVTSQLKLTTCSHEGCVIMIVDDWQFEV